jgi:type IV pilus assembly protein PilY1
VIDNLAKLTGQSYDQKHAYFVDGSPMTGDADLGENGTADGVSHTTDWSTVLVGTLGLGGKGYFVLDVTDPTSFTNSKVLTDRTRSGSDPKQDCTKLPTGAAKTTCEEKADIGYITAAPAFDQANQAKAAQIVRMNNNRWAVVLGNGYNSESHDAVLLIQYLDGDKKLKRILAPRANYINNKSSCSGSGTDNCDNGLSTPRLVDLDSDGRPDVAYAGDNYGHMWKFDLTSGNDAEWTTAFGGRPLFAANGPSSNKVGDDTNRNVPQAITAPPLVRANDLGIRALMVAFGTGRNVDTCDPFVIVTGGGAGVGGSPGVCSSTTANAVQTLYSILDRTTYSYRTPLGGTTSTRLQVNNIHESPVSIGNSKYAGGSPDKLNQRTIQSIGTSGGVDYFTITGAGANFSGTCSGSSCEEGWFMDLGTDGTAGTGERVLKALQFYQGTNIIAMYSGTPAKGSNNAGGESCDSSSGTDETQFLTFLNIMNGNTSSFGILDMNGDGKFDTGVASPDKNATRISTPPGDNTLMSTTGANGKEDHCNFDSNNKCTKLAPVPEVSMRPNWRQIE